MFNLLPENLKDRIKSEYKTRRFLVILLFILFIQTVFFIFLFPSWLASLYRENEIMAEQEEMNKSALASNVNSIVTVINSTNLKLKVINAVLEYPRIIPLASVVISKKPTGVHLNGLLYTYIDKSTAIISLEGISNTRESLVLFVKDLEKSGLFKKVDLPVSNLAKDKNISFSISLSVAS